MLMLDHLYPQSTKTFPDNLPDNLKIKPNDSKNQNKSPRKQTELKQGAACPLRGEITSPV